MINSLIILLIAYCAPLSPAEAAESVRPSVSIEAAGSVQPSVSTAMPAAKAGITARLSAEAGFEHGLSGSFAGQLGGRLIIAGGCNFPHDPLAPQSPKQYYSGIYAAMPTAAKRATPVSMNWERIATLPTPRAYGATASTPAGLVLIGGTDTSGSLAETLLLDRKGNLTPLPPLPRRIDNAAAAAIGNTVYLFGGNADGIPSRALWALDITAPQRGWQRLSDIPGNPRTQPAMAAANGELYVWGGFALRHAGNEPTLNTDGYRYNPTTDTWHPLPAPADDSGEPLSLGGGAATTLADGRIAVAGGVNKDIFLNAIIKTPDGYLQHPPEWYRFNKNVLVFDPATQRWTVLASSSHAARAGASIFAIPRGIFIYGGELKPRIRTPETFFIPLPAK